MNQAAIYNFQDDRGNKNQVTHLIESNQRSLIEINTSFLRHNITHINRLAAANKSQLGIVIKSDAYGHGMIPLAHELESYPEVAWLCTAGIEEALVLRQLGSTKQLLSMTYVDAPLQEAIINDIDVAVDDVALLRDCNAAAAQLKKRIRIHIKVDTGLSRLGVFPQDVLSTLHAIQKNYPWIETLGIFTHLADTNNADQHYTYQQLLTFNTVLQNLTKAGLSIPFTHALSSGGLTFPLANNQTYFFNDLRLHSMVRVGTNVYGLYKSEIQKERLLAYDPPFTLKPLLAWKSRIVSCSGGSQNIPKKVAVIPVGYADGYPQILAGKASVVVGKTKTAILEVREDFMIIDVSDLPELCLGESVTLIGNHDGITATELATEAQTINNELLTRLSPAIKRYLVEEDLQ
jgi:alanine racemase